MSLKASSIKVIPESTARIAKAAFRKGNRYMLLRDSFGDFFSTEDFRELFDDEGRPAIDPARLALITILQFAEGLSDARMADAVRSRIDLKYLLALPLDDPGFDESVLCEFRTRLIEGEAEMLLFERLLERFREHKLLRERGKQRTDSTHVLAAVRALNRLSCIGQTFRHTLNVLTTVAPEWLLHHSQAEWAERYAKRVELEHDVPPAKRAEREAFEAALAADGLMLLSAVLSPSAPLWLKEVPAVTTLWRVWIQNFTWTEEGRLRLRSKDEIPLARDFIGSPYDVDARLSRKRSTYWVGYKVHLTEMCDEDLPLVITNVETSPATTQDFDLVRDIHDALDERELLPDEHLVDMGYLSADLLVSEKQDHSVTLIGPARDDQKWQAWAGKGFAAEHFKVDWDEQKVTCPAGRTSASWTEAQDARGRPVIKIKFAIGDCRSCEYKLDCTKASRRTVTLQAQERHEALLAWRAQEDTEAFKALYAKRAGVEGTVSVGVRTFGMRRSRYFGFAKTRLQHLATASAMNLLRVADWLAEKPRNVTRLTAFERMLHMTA
jgi:transposase